MNNLGPWLVGLAVLLATLRWAFNWKAQRRYMREFREQNKKDSIDALAKQWKQSLRYDKAWAEKVAQQESRIAKIRSFANMSGITMKQAEQALKKLGKVYGRPVTQKDDYKIERIREGLKKVK